MSNAWQEERALLYRALRACKVALEQLDAPEDVLILLTDILNSEGDSYNGTTVYNSSKKPTSH